eukprot:2393870-Amphidinium_carterae.1
MSCKVVTRAKHLQTVSILLALVGSSWQGSRGYSEGDVKLASGTEPRHSHGGDELGSSIPSFSKRHCGRVKEVQSSILDPGKVRSLDPNERNNCIPVVDLTIEYSQLCVVVFGTTLLTPREC